MKQTHRRTLCRSSSPEAFGRLAGRRKTTIAQQSLRACVPPERDVCQNQLTAHSFVASPSNDFMTIGVLGTFLLLVIALLGRWSGSAKLTANGSGKLGVDHPARPTIERSAELGPKQIAAASRPARAPIILVGIGVF